MRRIARQRYARRHEGAGKCQAEWPGARLVDSADFAELQAEALLQLHLEDQIVALDQFAGIVGALGPDDGRTVVATIVGSFMRHRADDAGLAVFPLHGLDAGHVAQLRVDAVGGNQQAGA